MHKRLIVLCKRQEAPSATYSKLVSGVLVKLFQWEGQLRKSLSISYRIFNELPNRYSKCKNFVFDRLLNCCILGSQSKIGEYDH